MVNTARAQIVSQANQLEIERLSLDIQGKLIREIQKNLLVDDINFTGNLSASFHGGVSEEGFKTVETNNPYAVPVDRGMPPGTIVNFEGLKKWVKGKLGITDETEASDVTFKIRNKILAKGIQPTRFIKKSIKGIIAKHGAIRIVGMKKAKHKKSRMERFLSKAVRTTRTINKLLRKIDKTLGKIRKYKKTNVRLP